MSRGRGRGRVVDEIWVAMGGELQRSRRTDFFVFPYGVVHLC